ncbi:diguanylate cyclase [Paenibacillus sp. J31TS4]|uniref:dipeptidase n=1 Tax=Paenibacillus sp. J31TS4 TaxID=2807195 RepID=UPI001B2953B1|nr:membrane dipeptidase [Paenibacillus sp. J31TS4]GIP36893.1 diguanylate cyclase [Paenibacillus sp. J31TS4]
MKTIDSHCDLLYKFFLYPDASFDQPHPDIDTSCERLQKAGMTLQFFAIWLPSQPSLLNIETILRYIRLFEAKVLSHPGIQAVRTRQELLATRQSGRIGALLTLEGVDGLAGEVELIGLLHTLGVRSVGVTWNPANWAADGAMEPRNGGFTVKGKQLIAECDRLGLLLDVSHLSERGFWELLELTDRPFLASHSNAYAICPHPRNLRDSQIQAIVQRGGRIGLTFVGPFVRPEEPQIRDLLRHIDHIGSLGGSGVLGLGSDFDGMGADWKLPGLEHAGCYPQLYEELLKHYKESFVIGLFGGHWEDYLLRELPEG